MRLGCVPLTVESFWRIIIQCLIRVSGVVGMRRGTSRLRPSKLLQHAVEGIPAPAPAPLTAAAESCALDQTELLLL